MLVTFNIFHSSGLIIEIIAKISYLKEFQGSVDSEAHLFVQLRENIGDLGILLNIQLSNTP